MPKPKFEPIKVKGGWLFWDITVRSVRKGRESGEFVVTVTGNRSGRVSRATDSFPIPALLRAILDIAKQNEKKPRPRAGEVV